MIYIQGTFFFKALSWAHHLSCCYKKQQTRQNVIGTWRGCTSHGLRVEAICVSETAWRVVQGIKFMLFKLNFPKDFKLSFQSTQGELNKRACVQTRRFAPKIKRSSLNREQRYHFIYLGICQKVSRGEYEESCKPAYGIENPNLWMQLTA